MAAPDAPLDVRVSLALDLDMLSYGEISTELLRTIEACLMHHVWKPEHDWWATDIKIREHVKRSLGEDWEGFSTATKETVSFLQRLCDPDWKPEPPQRGFVLEKASRRKTTRKKEKKA